MSNVSPLSTSRNGHLFSLLATPNRESGERMVILNGMCVNSFDTTHPFGMDGVYLTRIDTSECIDLTDESDFN